MGALQLAVKAVQEGADDAQGNGVGTSFSTISEGVALCDNGTANCLTRIVMVEEDSDSRRYFQGILQSATDFELAGSFSTLDEVITKAHFLRARLVLLGLHQLGWKSLSCIKKLKRIIVGLKIVIVAGVGSPDVLEASLEVGAETCLIKTVSAAQCLATLRIAARGPTEVQAKPQKPKTQFFGGLNSEVRPSLSRREQEVMDFLADGLLYKEIADQLSISYSAVHKYQHQLFEKLQVGNRSEAIRAWLRVGPSSGV